MIVDVNATQKSLRPRQWNSKTERFFILACLILNGAQPFKLHVEKDKSSKII